MNSAGCLISSRLTADSAGAEFIPGLLMLGIGMTFSAIPLQQAAISSVSVADSGQATSMFNISRNLGASIGLAVLSSVLDQRMAFHHWRLHAGLGANDVEVQRYLAETGAALDVGPLGVDAAYRFLDARVMTEAMVMTFSDIFMIMAVLAFLVVPLVLFLRPLDPDFAKGMVH